MRGSGRRWAAGRIAATVLLMGVLGLVRGPARAGAAVLDSAITEPRDGAFQVQSSLSPNIVKIGEPTIYRARVIAYMKVQWLPPEPDSNFTWGKPRSGFSLAQPPAPRYGKQAAGTPPGTPTSMRPDTSWIEVPLQVFSPGIVPVPGMRFHAEWSGTSAPQTNGPFQRVPMAKLVVVNVLTSADSAKGLKDVHGPLGAPWWERVPLLWVLAALLLVALVIVIVRRPRRPKAVPVAPAVAVRRDPMAEALTALKALRALHLPENGRFPEHAFRLGQILRRYLEATVTLARPGDTTPELVAHLRGAGLAADDLQRLTALLRVWDRVKFAREPFTVEEAVKSEDAVEAHARARAPAREPAQESGQVA